MIKKAIRFFMFGGLVFAIQGCFFAKTKTVDPSTNKSAPVSFYTLKLKSLDGKEEWSMESFKGKKVLIVNTASECGYTPQYEGLQKLHEKYGDKLIVIGCPCNQFGGQEPGDASKIGAFCQKNYGVKFRISEKLDVRGDGQHAVYKWLCNKTQNGALDASVTWNFNKFLINEAGNLVGYYPSRVSPDDAELTAAIEK
jgi:glutathione peroxidase